MPSESDLMRRIQVRASALGARLFRNQTGFCTCRKQPIRYGIPSTGGGADLIGWTSCGRFLAAEIKSKSGRVSPHQARFLDAVRAAGGIAGVCREIKDLNNLLIPYTVPPTDGNPPTCRVTSF